MSVLKQELNKIKIMVRLTIILIISFFFSFTNSVEASHFVGGNLTYKFIGPGSTSSTWKYKVTLEVYRDCNGIAFNTPSYALTAYCSTSKQRIVKSALKTIYVSKPGERPANRGNKDISEICRNKNTRCVGSGNPGGVEVNFYEAIFELPACNKWSFFLPTSGCCRPSFANVNSSYFGHLNTLNSNSFPTNSSPDFLDLSNPLPNYCSGQDATYSVGAQDSDGDSLKYILDCSIERVDTVGKIICTNYKSGFSSKSPIPGLKLDSITGLITFKTSNTGKYSVTVCVIEYERCTGKEIGRVYREVQFAVTICTGKQPKDISGVSNVKGAVKKGNFKLEVCANTHFSWSDTIFDADVFDTIRFGSNLSQVMPNMKMSTTFLSRNKAVVKFEGIATVGNNPNKQVVLKFDDDRCDYPRSGFSVFEINVKNGVYAGDDQVLCLGDSANLEAEGGQKYTWRTISGSPMTIGSNWFPDTTSSDTGKTGLFIPSTTTLLEVKSNFAKGCFSSGLCSLIDTIQIKTVDSFSLKTVPDFNLCFVGNGQLNVVTSNNQLNYSYKWNNSAYLNIDSVKNPTFTNVKKKHTRFDVRVVSDSGCVREAGVHVNVSASFPKNMKANVSDSLICLSKQINFWIDKGKVEYQNCGLSTYECQGKFKNVDVGLGNVKNSVSISTYPTIYSGVYRGQKVQFLYRAIDLQAKGIESGPMRSIAFFIDSIYGGVNTSHQDFTIRIGCSNLSELPKSTYIQGLSEVYSPKWTTSRKGWNNHQFDSEYDWDGKSNLVVEICWELGTTVHLGNHIQSFDFQSYRSANSTAEVTMTTQPCLLSIPDNRVTNVLPKTRFNVCSGVRTSLYNYSWHPTSNGGFVGATNGDSAIANAHLSTAKNYFVVISDSATGKCKDTLSVNVNVVSSYNTTPDTLPIQCIHNGIIKLRAPTPWNITKPGGRWSGDGVVNDTLGFWDPNKSGLGKFWVKYSITGDRCSSIDSNLIYVVGLPDATILSPDSFCGIYGGFGTYDTVRHRLVPKNPGGWFRGLGVDSVINGNGDMVYFVDGTKFSPKPNNPDTAFVRYKLIEGCTSDSLFKIPVVAPWNHSFEGVLHNGKPFSAISFCATNQGLDTLSVAGTNPTWEYLDNPSAMVDRNLGVLNVKLASFGKDTIGRIKVGNYGYCGTDTIIQVSFVRPPQIEIIPKIYCNDVLQDTIYFNKKDTMLIRIPKGPLLVGSSAKKTLNPSGFDSTSEVMVKYVSIAQSGWPQAIDQSANQYAYNFWDGKPWLRTIRLGAYRISLVQQGKNEVRYTLGYRYRNNHPDFACSISDTSFVELKDSLMITLADTARLCGINTISLDAGKFLQASYIWENGYTNQTRVVSSQGVYSVTVTSEFCSNTKQIKVIDGCVGVEENLEAGVQIKLFPNPTSSIINLELSNSNSEHTQLRIIDLLGNEVSNTVFEDSKLDNIMQIDVSALAKGVYLFEVKNGESYSTYRVVIE